MIPIIIMKNNLISAGVVLANSYTENSLLYYNRPMLYKKYTHCARRAISVTRQLKRFVLWPDYGRSAVSVDLPEFIIKWVEYFDKTADPRDFLKLQQTVFSVFEVSAIPSGVTVNKDFLMRIIFNVIRNYPVCYGESFSAYGLLRGRVKEADYNALWAALYDVCDGCPNAKNILIEDLFAPLRASPARAPDHALHEFYAGLWLYDIATWRALLGNPLAADCQISSDPLEEMEVVVHVYRAAFTPTQRYKIFDSKRFFDNLATGKILKWREFSIDEVEEVWAALYGYFLRGSVPRDVLLKMVPSSKKLKRWYWTHLLMEEALPAFKWKYKKLGETIVNNLPLWIGCSAEQRREAAIDELEAKAAYKILSLALPWESIDEVFSMKSFNNDFQAARRAWPLNSSAEDKICRAFIARFSPRRINWIFEQLIVAFPLNGRDLASQERRIERLIEKNNGRVGPVKKTPWPVRQDKAEEEDLSHWVVLFTAAYLIFDYLYLGVNSFKAIIAAALYFILRFIAKKLLAGYSHKQKYDYLCDYIRVIICALVFMSL